jgi:hypothetical protein
VVLAGALLAGTAGCTFISQQATLIHYDPSDGVGVNLGDLKLRNVIALSDEDGKLFSLLVTFINTGSKNATVSLQYQSNDTKTTIHKLIAPGKTLSFGTQAGQAQIIIENPGVAAGALYPVYVQTGDAPGKQILVPVLTTGLAQYSTLKPTPRPTPTPTPTPVVTPEPTATPNS